MWGKWRASWIQTLLDLGLKRRASVGWSLPAAPVGSYFHSCDGKGDCWHHYPFINPFSDPRGVGDGPTVPNLGPCHPDPGSRGSVGQTQFHAHLWSTSGPGAWVHSKQNIRTVSGQDRSPKDRGSFSTHRRLLATLPPSPSEPWISLRHESTQQLSHPQSRSWKSRELVKPFQLTLVCAPTSRMVCRTATGCPRPG